MSCDRYAPQSLPVPRAARSAQRRQAPARRRCEGHSETTALSLLAAAEARIAALEAALHDARQDASHDPLTGVLNRRGLSESFAREAARARRNGQPLTLVLLDLDGFKQINDHYGHAAGDQALQHLVSLIGATLRPTDLCARLGGDEFVLLLPATDLAAARAALQRLQQSANRQPLPGTTLQLHFSAGLAQSTSSDNLDTLLNRADAGVYRAKRAGRETRAAA